MNTTAIVTILYGKNYQANWNKYCKNNWTNYARKFNYDLIIFDCLIDQTERGLSRSVSWQKCLILDQENIKKYERVIWIDSDILINDLTAPEITKDVPIEKIGAVDEFSFYSKENYRFLYDRLIAFWETFKITYISNKTPNDYYKNFGIATEINECINAGVLVLSPKFHNDLLKQVYYNYEDKGGGAWNYEMRPLSYEIVKNNFHFFINHRFNFMFNNYKMLYYPNTVSYGWSVYYKILRKLNIKLNNKNVQLAATSAYTNSYFLHFAGCSDEIRFVDQNIKTITDYL